MPSFSLLTRLWPSASLPYRSFHAIGLSRMCHSDIFIPAKILTVVPYSRASASSSLYHLPIRHFVLSSQKFSVGEVACISNAVRIGQARYAFFHDIIFSTWKKTNGTTKPSPNAGIEKTLEDDGPNRNAYGSTGDGFRYEWTRFSSNRGGHVRWVLLSAGLAVSCATFFFVSTDPVFAATGDAPNDVVLLACGSFNPPTIMHLRMFELARDHLRKDGRYKAIKGVISPVHHGYGKKGLVSAEHRIAMLKLATKDTSWLSIDDWEATQLEAWCRTVVVLRHVKDVHKKRVMLLCGADLLKSFAVPDLWKPEDMEEILAEYGVVVITRSGTDLPSVIEQLPILSRHKDNIFIVTENMTNEISSTKIREALKNGESVRYFVPDAVLDYIYKNGLYGSNEAP